MVRDKQRRKMSKQLGNSPDALQLISEFGADGVRFGMLSCSPAGGDLLFDEKLVEQGRNFCNKIWNALRLLKSLEIESKPMSQLDQVASKWIKSRFNQVASELQQDYKEYKLSEAVMRLYTFVWGDFCSWYLEMIKPDYQSKIGSEILDFTNDIFSQICSLLHPFMPFITEEIFHQLNDIDRDQYIMNESYPQGKEFDSQIITDVTMAKDIVSNVRDIRNKNGLKARELLELSIIKTHTAERFMSNSGLVDLCKKMAYLDSFNLVEKEGDSSVSFITGTENLFVTLEQNIDFEAELESLSKDLSYQQGFVKGIQAKLNNDKFVNGAPAPVVQRERKKLKDGLERIKLIEQAIAKLKP
jgi:valyl-tRNA synthetase